MVRRGWLLSLSSVTISHVPAASWPGNIIATQEAGSEGRHRKQQKGKQNLCVSAYRSVQGYGSERGTWGSKWGHGFGALRENQRNILFLKLHQLFYRLQLTVIIALFHLGISSDKFA